MGEFSKKLQKRLNPHLPVPPSSYRIGEWADQRGLDCRLKGVFRGNCNVSTCLAPNSAFFFNKSTKAHYCIYCARAINKANRTDCQQLYGCDDLCEIPTGRKAHTIQVDSEVRQVLNDGIIFETPDEPMWVEAGKYIAYEGSYVLGIYDTLQQANEEIAQSNAGRG